MKGMMALAQFKQFLGITELQFVKGKGRQFTGTPVGTVFMSKDYDKSKPSFVTVAGESLKTASGESLAGTLWLCNGNLTNGDVV
jgi:hypothetical protein